MTPIREVTAVEFAVALAKARKTKRGFYISRFTGCSQFGARCFLMGDGYAGGALYGEEIGSVFSLQPGLGGEIVRHLISVGGRKLNCLGDGLRDYYEGFGFHVVAKTPWHDALAPEGWSGDMLRWGTNWYSMELN